jgi:hypothetical protein
MQPTHLSTTPAIADGGQKYDTQTMQAQPSSTVNVRFCIRGKCSERKRDHRKRDPTKRISNVLTAHCRARAFCACLCHAHWVVYIVQGQQQKQEQ